MAVNSRQDMGLGAARMTTKKNITFWLRAEKGNMNMQALNSAGEAATPGDQTPTREKLHAAPKTDWYFGPQPT